MSGSIPLCGTATIGMPALTGFGIRGNSCKPCQTSAPSISALLPPTRRFGAASRRDEWRFKFPSCLSCAGLCLSLVPSRAGRFLRSLSSILLRASRSSCSVSRLFPCILIERRVDGTHLHLSAADFRVYGIYRCVKLTHLCK